METKLGTVMTEAYEDMSNSGFKSGYEGTP